MHGRGRSSHLLVGAAAVPDGTRGDCRCRRGAAAAWSVERRWVNLRRPMPTVRAGFSARAASPRAAQTGCDVADPGAVVRDEVQASAASRGRGGGSRQKPPSSSASRPPFQEHRSKPKSAFQSPCGLRGNGHGAGVSAGQSSCEGVGRVPRPSPVDGAHVPDQRFPRTYFYGGSSNQINLLRAVELAALARGTGRVRMVGAGAPGVSRK